MQPNMVKIQKPQSVKILQTEIINFHCHLCRTGHEQIAKLLIENKYSVNHLNNEKQTPLDLSAIEGSPLQIIEISLASFSNILFVVMMNNVSI